MYAMEDDETINGIAFLDVNIYVTSLSSVKNIILVGDVLKSVLCIGFQVYFIIFTLYPRSKTVNLD